MAAAQAGDTGQALATLNNYPIVRQLGLMIGIAASVALGVAIVMWSQTPNYSLLYSSVSEQEAGAIIDALNQNKIPYKIDPASGALMVPASEVQAARLKLAGLGLPKSANQGFELIQKEQGFGTSQFIQSARYQHAMEEELARTISTIHNVKSARVHLALPKQSVFVRDRKKPSASVTVNLYSGRRLDDEQVAAISYMVSSSIPNLDPDQVTVVDHMGRLLTSTRDSRSLELNADQLEYTQKIEDNLGERVNTILLPFLGSEGFKAQVSADIDFTVTEETSERFNPDLPAVRSRQDIAESMSAQGLAGVPGALANQPPGGSVVPEEGGIGGDEEGGPSNVKRRTTTNYELDKTISHTKLATGRVSRLSVAVVVDDKRVIDEATGEAATEPRTQEELDKITALVREAVGFNAQRGDTVQVTNAAFAAKEAVEALPEIPMWEQPWFWDLLKQVAGALVVLYLIFGVLKPAFKNLATPAAPVEALQAEPAAAGGGEGGAAAVPPPEEMLELTGNDANYDQHLNMAKKIVGDDPKIAAQVVRNWVGEE